MFRIWVRDLAQDYFLRAFHNGCPLAQMWFEGNFFLCFVLLRNEAN